MKDHAKSQSRNTRFQMNDSEIFLAAVQIEDPAVRAAFLKSCCQENSDQLNRIVARLEQYRKWIGVWDGIPNRLAENIKKFSENPRDGDDAKSNEKLEVWLAGTRFGAYEVLRCLGAGGMGEVYLARDVGVDQASNRLAFYKFGYHKVNVTVASDFIDGQDV